MLIGKELWDYLIERGVEKHDHPNGLMSCYKCATVVATGKIVEQLDKEWADICIRIGRDMGFTDEEMYDLNQSIKNRKTD